MSQPPSVTIATTTSPQQELVQSFRTITEMLRDRGDDSSALEQMSSEDLIHAASGRLIFYVDDPVSGYRIIYDLSSKFKLQNIKKMLDASAEGIHTFIIVVRKWALNTTSASSVAEKAAKDMGVNAQFFELRRLQFNLSKHFLVPKHEPMRDEAQIAEVLDEYMLKSRFQLPIIYDKDPMAQYLALKHGQLVKITRSSPTAGSHVMYRCCCTKAE